MVWIWPPRRMLRRQLSAGAGPLPSPRDTDLTSSPATSSSRSPGLRPMRRAALPRATDTTMTPSQASSMPSSSATAGERLTIEAPAKRIVALQQGLSRGGTSGAAISVMAMSSGSAVAQHPQIRLAADLGGGDAEAQARGIQHFVVVDS